MTMCTAGFYCEQLATSLTRCPAGHSCPHNGTCDPTPCKPGTYSPNTGSRACAACPSGFTTVGAGATSAGDCSVPAPPSAGFRRLLNEGGEGGFVQEEAPGAKSSVAGGAAHGPLKLSAASFLVLVLSGMAVRSLLPRPAAACSEAAAEPAKPEALQ